MRFFFVIFFAVLYNIELDWRMCLCSFELFFHLIKKLTIVALAYAYPIEKKKYIPTRNVRPNHLFKKKLLDNHFQRKNYIINYYQLTSFPILRSSSHSSILYMHIQRRL